MVSENPGDASADEQHLSTSTGNPPPPLNSSVESPGRLLVPSLPTASGQCTTETATAAASGGGNALVSTGKQKKPPSQQKFQPTNSSNISNGPSSFPTPFKCCGDFCGFVLQEDHPYDVKQHGSGRSASSATIQDNSSASGVYSKYVGAMKALPASTAIQMLFSKDELHSLGDDNLSQLLTSIHVACRQDRFGTRNAISNSSASDELHVITYKSIALAKANRDHLMTTLQVQSKQQHRKPVDRFDGASASPLASKSKPNASSKAQTRRSSLFDSTAAQECREGSRTRVYGELEGVANYYRQVRVCGDCYAIYSLLDMARKLLLTRGSHISENPERERSKQRKPKEQQKEAPQKLRDEWEKHVQREVQEKEKLYLRKSNPKLTQSERSNSVEDLELTKLELGASTETAATPSDRRSSEADGILPVLPSPKGTAAGSSPGFTSSSGGNSVSMPALPSASQSSATSSREKSGKHATGIHSFLKHTQQSTYASNESTTKQLLRSSGTYKGMEKYLRGESKQMEEPNLVEGQLFKASGGGADLHAKAPVSAGSASASRTPASSVLLVDSDMKSLELLHSSLSSIPSLTLEIESIVDAQDALQAAKTLHYDLILCEREFAPGSLSGLEFVKMLRQFEVQKSIARQPNKPQHKRTTVVCVTSRTSRDDLQLYKDVGMDGCVGKPINPESLRHTVQAALAKVSVAHTSALDPAAGGNAVTNATEALANAKLEQLERKKRRRRRMEASSALPFPGLADMEAREDYVAGTFQMDAETSMPFCVMGNPELQPQHVSNTFFNLVVIHDIFETWERLQILLNPIIARYHGAIQVLVWNYPGQAYTTWRTGTLLNNAYHVQCFHALLQHVGHSKAGLKLLRDAPYYLMGIGNGGNIATKFCVHSPPLDVNTRALLLVNSFAFVDAQLAQFLHDCLKVFACTPESRPDLPVYFHTRFLFSSSYLAWVSTPLALNLYTAVMNPITLDGRKALCQGALTHVDLRGDLERLRIPLLNVCSSQNALVNAGSQTQDLIELCGLDAVESIGKVLRQKVGQRRKQKQQSCIVWLPSGHEVFQECKQEMLLLIEQLITGFHEMHDAAPPGGKVSTLQHHSAGSAVVSSKKATMTDRGVPSRGSDGNARRDEDDVRAKQKPIPGATANKASSFEDSFIDNVLSTVKQVVATSDQSTTIRPLSRGKGTYTATNNNQLQSPEKAQWTQFQQEKAQKSMSKAAIGPSTRAKACKSTGQVQQTSSSKVIAMASWDPTTPAFERLSSNIIYKVGDGSKIYPDTTTSAAKTNLPELKEYMAWRVKRNHKRLQRMDKQARVIQRAFRAFYARTLLLRIKQERCAVQLQRLWRAKAARKKYKGMKKDDWAVRLLQRNWRGKMGRDSYRDRMRKYLAAIDIQRIVRGFLAVRFVTRVRQRMHNSAVEIQRLVRRYLAKHRMFKQRQRRNAAVVVQRVFRGHIGRKRFAHEKDKFLYSKTQSQGIAFGKQMLMEYKLYGTKLQSEVALLAKAKEDVEAQAEVLVNEICEFDEGIRLLESEMHTLSQVETESMAKSMDEQGKWQLREQKMRLDREFTQMLAQIALRKEKLSVMEEKLQQLDKERLAKEEELKGLERKLVVLLEEQQQELAKIKQKQHTRNQLMLDILPPSGSPGFANGGPGTPGFHAVSSPYGSNASPWTGGSPASTLNGSSTPSAVANSASAFTQQQREEANSLMESTETMMKFGFMSMSMTYFSSMNMVRAMRKIGAHHMTLDSAAVVSNKKWPEYSTTAGSSNPGSPFAGVSSASPMSFGGGGSLGSGSGFQPGIPPGSFPGQQPLHVTGWSVADIGRWLDTLALGQYKRAFSDAAVDGALLLHLNDEDLKNTLGMEHRLHRKKILTSVEQLRESERIKMKKLYGANGPDSLPTAGGVGNVSPPRSLQGSAGTSAPVASVAPASSPSKVPSMMGNTSSSDSDASASAVAGANLKVVVSFPEFCTLVRHGKVKQIKEALGNVPDRRFDSLTVMQPFNPGVGTIYDDLLEKSVFHINKSDENGNSPLLLAAQNNNLKVAQLLLTKGANPNHQNVSASCRHVVHFVTKWVHFVSDLCTLSVNDDLLDLEKRQHCGPLRHGVQLLRPGCVAVGPRERWRP